MRMFLTLALATGVAMAEIHTLTLKQAVELALKQNPDVLLARYDEIKAQQAVREARDPFSPKVVVGSGLAYSSGFPLSIEGSAPSVIRADASQALFNREKSIQAARAREQARGAGIDLQSKREEVALNTANAFLEVERVARSVSGAEQQAQSLERVADTTRVRVEGGHELPIEAKRINARLAQARHRAFSLRNEQAYQEEALAVLLGFPGGDRIRAAPEERRVQSHLADEAEVVERAVASSQALKSLESKMQAAGLDIKASRAARLPTVDLVAQYGLFARYNNYEDFFKTFQRHNGQVGVSFRLPLVAGPGASARAQQAETESARLRVQLNHTRNQVGLEARRVLRDLRSAESYREVAKLDLDAAREQISVLTALFAEGRSGLRQVEEARVTENDKWLEYLDAQHRVERLQLTLLKQTGDLLAALQ